MLIDEIFHGQHMIGEIVSRARTINFILKMKAKRAPNVNLIWKDLCCK